MGWMITLGILTALAVLPLGVDVRYHADGARVCVAVWKFSVLIYPRPPKKKKPEPKKKEQTAASPQESLPQPPQPPKKTPEAGATEKKGGSLTDFLPFVKLALDLLNGLRRRLRLEELELRLTMAGDDPYDLVMNYGKTWAAAGNLLPLLDRWFVIKKRDVQMQCDFTASETLIFAHLRLTITVGRILSIAVVYGFRALKEYFTLKNKRKGGADQ